MAKCKRHNSPLYISSERRFGFTLVELIVVIGIIIILIAIVLPVLSSARAHSQRIVCLNNLKSIGIAISQYADENNDFLPNNEDKEHPYTAYNAVFAFSNGRPRPLKLACLQVEDFIDARLFYCPSSDTRYEHYCDPTPWGTLPQTYNEPPTGNGNQWVRTSYYYYPQSREKDSDGYPLVASKYTMLDYRKSIVTDNMWNLDAIPHSVGGSANIRKVICAVFGDGHAAACSNDEAFKPELWLIDTKAEQLSAPENYKTIRPSTVEFKEILSKLSE